MEYSSLIQAISPEKAAINWVISGNKSPWDHNYDIDRVEWDPGLRINDNMNLPLPFLFIMLIK